MLTIANALKHETDEGDEGVLNFCAKMIHFQHCCGLNDSTYYTSISGSSSFKFRSSNMSSFVTIYRDTSILVSDYYWIPSQGRISMTRGPSLRQTPPIK